jgi:hypothetical protein
VGETVDRCERCGGPVRRVFSAPALIFKGPGFHINDYRKSPPPADGDGKASAKTSTDADKSASSATSTGKGGSKGSSKGSSKDSSPASGSGGDTKAS